MSKKLKQSALFDRLKKYNVSMAMYLMMYKIHTNQPILKDHLRKLDPTLYLADGDLVSLTEKGNNILISIDDLFYAKKKAKIDEYMGIDYQKKIKDFLEQFPTAKLPSNSYARSNAKDIERNLLWFFEEYDNKYNWNTIMQATNLYVNEYKINNYNYMQTAMYFIRKADANRIVKSNLANYCDRYLDAGSYKEDAYFKTKVI